VTGNPHTTIRFGDLLLDLGSRELRHAGNTVHLSPKAFDLLAILVLNRPKALSKSELQEHLWPNTFVVEKNLSNLVSESARPCAMTPAVPGSCARCRDSGMPFSSSRTSRTQPGRR
jgi:hypothetical protein